MTQETLDTRFMIRVNSVKLEQCKQLSQQRYGTNYNDLFRETMQALIDGRLRIIPTDEQRETLKTKEELYDVN